MVSVGSVLVDLDDTALSKLDALPGPGGGERCPGWRPA
jgi:hypothetical protein